MALYPETRVVIETTGVAVTTLPPFSSLPPVDSHLYLTLNSDAEVQYKIERYETYCHSVTQAFASSPNPVGYDVFVNMIVSVVP